tara:strand:- start:6 stop:206 length:201 start_codon:yes stop_codon:yes gene_type:complete
MDELGQNQNIQEVKSMDTVDLFFAGFLILCPLALEHIFLPYYQIEIIQVMLSFLPLVLLVFGDIHG